MRYITPDSLFAQHPSADSTGHVIILAATRPDTPDGPSALYTIRSDGSGLDLLTYVPFQIDELVAGPEGTMALFTGRSPTSMRFSGANGVEHIRLDARRRRVTTF